MARGRLIFNKIDLVAPWGICLIAAGLCLLGAVKAPELPAKIISGSLGGLFLAAIPLWYICRRWLRKVSYVTKHGINVICGAHNHPMQGTLEVLVDDAVSFWVQARWEVEGIACSITEKQCLDSLKDTWFFFVDKEKLTIAGMHARGYVSGKDAVIGWNGKLDYVNKLVRHEVSHVFLNQSGFSVLSGEEQHALFKEVNLGA